jgi:hypothetical protein
VRGRRGCCAAARTCNLAVFRALFSVASCPAVRRHRWPSSPDATSERDRRKARMRTCMQTLPCGVVVRCVPRVALRAACVTPECFGAGRLCSAPPVQATDTAAVRHCGRRPGETVAPPASITTRVAVLTAPTTGTSLLSTSRSLFHFFSLSCAAEHAESAQQQRTGAIGRPGRLREQTCAGGAAARTGKPLRASSFVLICLRNNASWRFCVASCPAVRRHRWPSSPDATSERDRRKARMRTCMQTLPCGVVVRCVPRVALRAACVRPECFGAGRLCSAPPVQATDTAAERERERVCRGVLRAPTTGTWFSRSSFTPFHATASACAAEHAESAQQQRTGAVGRPGRQRGQTCAGGAAARTGNSSIYIYPSARFLYAALPARCSG